MASTKQAYTALRIDECITMIGPGGRHTAGHLQGLVSAERDGYFEQPLESLFGLLGRGRRLFLISASIGVFLLRRFQHQQNRSSFRRNMFGPSFVGL